MVSTINLVFADDNQYFRNAVSEYICQIGGVNVVAEAGNGMEALEYVRTLSPDILLLDMDMPGLDGVTVAQIIRSENIPVKIIVLSVFEEDKFVRSIVDIGVSGYLLKDESPKTLLSVINRIHQGEAHFYSPAVAEKLRRWGYIFDNRLEHR